MTYSPSFATATLRFRDYIDILMRVIVTRLTMGLPQSVAMPLSNRLCRMRERFLAIVGRLVADKPPVSRPAGLHRSAPIGPRPDDVLPRHRGWLREVMPTEAPALAGNLSAMLGEPAMEVLIAAAPALRRDLRSLCWMLAITPPPALARPPRPPKPKADKPPKPAAPQPDQPAPAPQGPWRRIPSAHWPKGVIDRRRKTT